MSAGTSGRRQQSLDPLLHPRPPTPERISMARMMMNGTWAGFGEEVSRDEALKRCPQSILHADPSKCKSKLKNCDKHDACPLHVCRCHKKVTADGKIM
jgi:hypothetical protein